MIVEQFVVRMPTNGRRTMPLERISMMLGLFLWGFSWGQEDWRRFLSRIKSEGEVDDGGSLMVRVFLRYGGQVQSDLIRRRSFCQACGKVRYTNVLYSHFRTGDEAGLVGQSPVIFSSPNIDDFLFCPPNTPVRYQPTFATGTEVTVDSTRLFRAWYMTQ